MNTYIVWLEDGTELYAHNCRNAREARKRFSAYANCENRIWVVNEKPIRLHNFNIMNSININGCSACQSGKENYCSYTTRLRGKRVKMYQYDYRTQGGDLFTCCASSLEACRTKRDKWLSSRQ